MGIWRNHIFVVLNQSVEIFAFPLFEYLPNPAYHFGCQSLCIPMAVNASQRQWIGSAFLFEYKRIPLESTLREQTDEQEDSLHVSFLTSASYHDILVLIQSPEDGVFSWDLDATPDRLPSLMTLKYCIGRSNEYQLRLTSTQRVRYPIVLEIMRPTPPSIENRYTAQWNPVLPISGLPNLESTSAMDFDDAAGVVLLGSCRGQITVIQFLDRPSQARGSLLEKLPLVCHDPKGLPSVS